MKNLYFPSSFRYFFTSRTEAQIAQSVEQSPEKACVGGSIPSLGTNDLQEAPELKIHKTPFTNCQLFFAVTPTVPFRLGSRFFISFHCSIDLTI